MLLTIYLTIRRLKKHSKQLTTQRTNMMATITSIRKRTRWFVKVKNSETGKYIQYTDLAAEYRTDENKAKIIQNRLLKKTPRNDIQKANPNTVSLAIKRVDTNGQNVSHHQISKYKDFVGRPFDDLWAYMENITVPIIKRDRYDDNLEGSHIK